MAFITRKITRTSQPQELVGIDWSNPLASGIASVLCPSISKNDIALNSRPLAYGTTSITVGSDGLQLTTPSSNSGVGFTGGWSTVVPSESPISFYTRVYVEQLGTRGVIAADWSSAGGSESAFIQKNYTNTWSFGGGGVLHVTGGAVTLGWHTVVASADAEGWFLWVDGVRIGQDTFSSRKPGVSAKWLGSGAYNGGIGWVGSGSLLCVSGAESSDSLAADFHSNPWQIFEPIEETIWIPDGVSVTLPTLVQPVSTTSAGTWTPTGAATLHEAIDEATYSDADYISVAAASTCELVLAESAFPTGNVSLAYRALSSTGSTLTVTLKQGATTIMTRTHALTGTATLYTQALTAGEVAAIVAGPITCTLTSS